MYTRDYEMSLLVAFKDGMEIKSPCRGSNSDKDRLARNVLSAKNQEKELRCFAKKKRHYFRISG